MRIGVTGHRPDKLGLPLYDADNPTRTRLRAELEKCLVERAPETLITGMALGFDQDAARVAIQLGIPFIAAVPFEGQEKLWKDADRRYYRKLLANAFEVTYVAPPGYAPWKMQMRNEWIVDHCDLLIAAFNGSPGGTANTVLYAQKVRREILIIDPSTF